MKILNDEEIMQVSGGIGPLAGAFAGAGIAVVGSVLGGVLSTLATWGIGQLLPSQN